MSSLAERLRLRRSPPVGVVAINRRPRHEPWGGGNQWIDQIIRWLTRSGYLVRYRLDTPVDCILLADPRRGAQVTFDIDDVAKYKQRYPQVPCIQRVNDNDKHRGSDFRDRLQAEGNAVADHTVFLSRWLRDYECGRWFDPAQPHSVIHNGADASVFHPIGSAVFDGTGPLRLVTHHWSDDWNKGFSEYAALDGLIADGALRDAELWVIGRWPADLRWRSAKLFAPTRGHALASLLRQCHVYVTASRWEAGGMHFIEGLQCGLPVLYHADGGGVVEVAQRFGLEYTGDIAGAVAAMRDRYADFRAAVLDDPPSGDRMCLEYRTLIQRVITQARSAPGRASSAGQIN
jgi:glycosyltransferase involved in cell wall biosynthesis